jgi:hypothetical protein
MSEERAWEIAHQNAMDFKDQIAYEQGTLIIPTGEERQCAWVDKTDGGETLFCLEDNVVHVSGLKGVVQRIVWWKRISLSGKDFSYFVIHYETVDGQYLSDSADRFAPNTGIVDWEIPI